MATEETFYVNVTFSETVAVGVHLEECTNEYSVSTQETTTVLIDDSDTFTIEVEI